MKVRYIKITLQFHFFLQETHLHRNYAKLLILNSYLKELPAILDTVATHKHRRLKGMVRISAREIDRALCKLYDFMDTMNLNNIQRRMCGTACSRSVQLDQSSERLEYVLRIMQYAVAITEETNATLDLMHEISSECSFQNCSSSLQLSCPGNENRRETNSTKKRKTRKGKGNKRKGRKGRKGRKCKGLKTKVEKKKCRKALRKTRKDKKKKNITE